MGNLAEALLPTCHCLDGKFGRILGFVRPKKTCPANDFLSKINPNMRRRFAGQFHAITKLGGDYINNLRFRPVTVADTVLWEFREDGHRLYCFRKLVPPNSVVIVLFSGWVQQPSDRSGREQREIKFAQFLYREFIAEYEGGQYE